MFHKRGIKKVAISFNPKIHLKMKKLFLVLALCVFAFIGCDDEKTDNSNNTLSIAEETVSGKLKLIEWEEKGDLYWEHHYGYLTDEVDEIQGMVSDRINICNATVSGGEFSLKLPAPKVEHLWLNVTNQMPENITISDKDAMWTSISFEGYKEGIFVGNIYMSSTSKGGGGIATSKVCLDRDVQVTGIVLDTLGYNEEEGYFIFTDEINLNLKKGWNTIVSGYDEDKGVFFKTANKILEEVEWAVYVSKDDNKPSRGRECLIN